MPFDLYNAPTTFQRCMMVIFIYMVENFVEVFMDDFSIFGDSYDDCLTNLAKVLKDMRKQTLSLTWRNATSWLEKVIENLPPPVTIKGIRIFQGHANFYQRFINDFSKISKPLCTLLEKDTTFEFNESCLGAFEKLKKWLVSAPIIVTPDWNSPFELMYDASNFTVGAVMGQWRNKKRNREPSGGPSVKVGTTLGNSSSVPINENFPYEHIFEVSQFHETPWFEDYANYLACGKMPFGTTCQQRKKIPS
ncbi:Retrovirus-related Pol polyprotein from transposon 17.6 [Gossypium australe]|uniref:Retrovirus-related Pol polyprotein from transposon 17.6 n=1 Tax=Gossypium australe TaxID=47621 RepID=A0A5B6WG28_9ROSI|nr:Retrovirus-related Pol polyprotein from transposon 17.6 [Gossypium australe]